MTDTDVQGLQLILIAAAAIVSALVAFLWWKVRPDIVLVGGHNSQQEQPKKAAQVFKRTAVPHHLAQGATSQEAPKLRLAPLEAVVSQLIQSAPHIGIIGKTGDGKTTTGEAIIRLLHGEAFVVDPKWWRGKWGGLAAVGIDDDAGYSQIATGLRAVFAEFNRRRIYKRDNPNATFTDLWLIWDEINDTMEEIADAGVPLRRLLRVGREYNVHVLFFPQSDRVGALGLDGHGDAVDNVLWVYLGADARKVVNRLVADKKMDTANAQYILGLARPCVVAHRGQHYAVDVSNAVALAQGHLTTMSSWELPGPGSEDQKNENLALGPADLPIGNPSKKWPELREAAIQHWIREGLSDTAIAVKIDMRKEDARLLAKSIRATLEQDEQKKVLQKLVTELPVETSDQPLAA